MALHPAAAEGDDQGLADADACATAVREPGSNVTLAPLTRAGLGAVNSGSTRTVPVNQSAGPLPEGFEPLRVISIARLSFTCSAEMSIRHVRPALG